MAELALLSLVVGVAAGTAPKPHLMYVLADDFGHHDIGFNGGDQPTPVLDALAADGVKLDRYYVYQFCSPTRSSFLSGRLPIHVNEENNPSSKPGGVDPRMTTVGEQLSSAGYYCSVAGKWHGGAYLEAQLPVHRGFDASLTFLNGNEDHYTQFFGILHGVDLFEGDAPALGKNGSYGAFMYTAHHLSAIATFTGGATGKDALFLYMPFQNTHSPYEAPVQYLNDSVTSTASKRQMFGMIACLDESVGNVTSALKAANLWANTLLVFSADNGGEIGDAGNNYPLRGGKYTDFEGGTRVAAFVSGGLVEPAARGSRTQQVIHICDMWATFSSLAGLPDLVDHRAAQYPGVVPPVDSLNVLPALTQLNGTSPRTTIAWALSDTALVLGNYKILTENGGGKNEWVDEAWPAYDGNNSHSSAEKGPACKPCVFDVAADPEERTDLVRQGGPKNQALVAELTSLLAKAFATKFSTGDAGFHGNYTECTDIDSYKAAHGGFLGPLCQLCTKPGGCGGPPPPPPGGGGVAIRHAASGLCLVPAELEKSAPVSMGSCNASGAKVFKVEAGGFVYMQPLTAATRTTAAVGGSAAAGGALCLRPTNPPQFPASCKPGTDLMLGNNGCVKLGTGQLSSPDCAVQKLCVSETPGDAPQLGPCGAAGTAATGWAVV